MRRLGTSICLDEAHNERKYRICSHLEFENQRLDDRQHR